MRTSAHLMAIQYVPVNIVFTLRDVYMWKFFVTHLREFLFI